MNPFKPEIHEKVTIKDAIKVLENRITVIMAEFEQRGMEIVGALSMRKETFIDTDELKNNKEIAENITRMCELYLELKPIERLIRYKYKYLKRVFDLLAQIEGEKEYGKLFAFLAELPHKNRSNAKNIFINQSLPNNASLS